MSNLEILLWDIGFVLGFWLTFFVLYYIFRPLD